MPAKSGKNRKQRAGKLAYSTDAGRICLLCGKPKTLCSCHSTFKSSPPGDGIIRLLRERKGRKGKGVTLISGLELSEADMVTLAKKLKSGCGVGGTVKSGVIELQMADREKIKLLLEAAGFTVKIAGG